MQSLLGTTGEGITASDWLVAGATVLSVIAGVVLERIVSERFERKRQLRAAVLELAMVLPHVVAPLTAAWTGPRDTSLGSQWWANQERATELLAQLRGLSEGWPRRRRRLAAEVDDLAARVTAAHSRFALHGDVLPASAVHDLTPVEIRRLAFRSRGPIDDEVVAYYLAHGADAPRPRSRTPWWRRVVLHGPKQREQR